MLSAFMRSGLAVAITAALTIHPVATSARVADVGNGIAAIGDTLVPKFAFVTDTSVLSLGSYRDSAGVAHSYVLLKKCGRAVIFGGWAIRKNGVDSAPIVRDSVTLSIGGRSPPTVGINGDTTVDPAKFPPGVCL